MGRVLTVEQKGNFKKLNSILERLKELFHSGYLDRIGQDGVAALMAATPVDSGNTAQSWYYTIERTRTSVSIIFSNKNVQNGCNIAILLQYGHGTKTGAWVEGKDYINPALQNLFDTMANNAWKEATKA